MERSDEKRGSIKSTTRQLLELSEYDYTGTITIDMHHGVVRRVKADAVLLIADGTQLFHLHPAVGYDKERSDETSRASNLRQAAT